MSSVNDPLHQDDKDPGPSQEYMRGFNDAIRKAEDEAREYGRNIAAGRMFAERIANFIRDIRP